jgi:hypothetical protein
MRPDQIARLRDVEEKLADLFIDEANPDNWPCPGEASHKIDSDARSNRFRCKRAAIDTGALLVRTQSLMQIVEGEGDRSPDMDRWLEQDIGRAEEAAKKAVDRAMARNAKRPA